MDGGTVKVKEEEKEEKENQKFSLPFRHKKEKPQSP